MCEDKEEKGPDSEHHGLTMVDSSHTWQAFPWNKLEPGFSFQFGSLLVCK